MTAASALIARARFALDDAVSATWSDNQLLDYTKAGIADYRQHFPAQRRYSVSVAAGTNAYTLPSDFISVIAVEYPDAQTPRKFLRQKELYTGALENDDDSYTIFAAGDDATDHTPEIYLSNPSVTDTCIVTYLSAGELPTGLSSDLDVPAHHEYILIAFLVWWANLQLLNAQQQTTPTAEETTGEFFNEALAKNVERFEAAYRRILEDAQHQTEPRAPISWAAPYIY